MKSKKEFKLLSTIDMYDFSNDFGGISWLCELLNFNYFIKETKMQFYEKTVYYVRM